jgi:hypothetical protein
MLYACFSVDGKRSQKHFNYETQAYRGLVRSFPSQLPTREHLTKTTPIKCSWGPQLCAWVLDLCTGKGDSVADMMCGSGVLSVVAASMGRSVIMVDNDMGSLTNALQAINSLADSLFRQGGDWSFYSFFGWVPEDGRPLSKSAWRAQEEREKSKGSPLPSVLDDQGKQVARLDERELSQRRAKGAGGGEHRLSGTFGGAELGYSQDAAMHQQEFQASQCTPPGPPSPPGHSPAHLPREMRSSTSAGSGPYVGPTAEEKKATDDATAAHLSQVTATPSIIATPQGVGDADDEAVSAEEGHELGEIVDPELY